MGLTNLVVNQTARNIMQQFSNDLEKAHQVGDVHPTHPDWVWTQLPNGKYDWRVKKNASSAQVEAGNHKGSVKEEPKVKQQKDERFSEDGIVGKDGGFNKQGKTYKRWADLREKVESGKATPEEKKEFAHLHNQYLNEKDRNAYEKSKQSDPKAKEPKYKTVDERRAEYEGKKKIEQGEQKSVSPEVEKLMSKTEIQNLMFDAQSTINHQVAYNGNLLSTLALGVPVNSPKIQEMVNRKVKSEFEGNRRICQDLYDFSKKHGVNVLRDCLLSSYKEERKRIGEIYTNGRDGFDLESLIPLAIDSAISAIRTGAVSELDYLNEQIVKNLDDDGKQDLINDIKVATETWDGKQMYGKVVDGVKVGTIDGNKVYTVSDTGKGQWQFISEVKDIAAIHRERYHSSDGTLSVKNARKFKIGQTFTDKKGRVYTVDKIDPIYGFVRIRHTKDDGKKIVIKVNDRAFDARDSVKSGLFTTGLPDLDEFIKNN